MTQARAQVEWVPANKVIPNPLNPRRNDSVHSDQMRRIISKRGWEEPLTVYRKGSMYVVLAGHRRLNAAKEMGVKEIPVFVVEQPDNYQEEIERIASLQSGRIDWTPYEWAKFTYERWVAWDKPPYNKFGRMLDMKENRVRTYISVFENFPRNEIENRLEKGILNITTLEYLVVWMKKLKMAKPDLVENMTEDLIRQSMLRKMEDKLVSHRDLSGADHYLNHASEEDIRDFIINPRMSLAEAQEPYGVASKGTDMVRSVNIRMGRMSRDIKELKIPDKDKAKAVYAHLEGLIEVLKSKMEHIEKTTGVLPKDKRQ